MGGRNLKVLIELGQKFGLAASPILVIWDRQKELLPAPMSSGFPKQLGLEGAARNLSLAARGAHVVDGGALYSTVEDCRGWLYKEALAEFDRIVNRKHGRMVLITSLEQEEWLLRAAGVPAAGACAAAWARAPWTVRARRRTPLGFLDAVVLVLVRSAAGAAPACELPELSDRLWWETASGRGGWPTLKVSQRPPMQPARGREI
ncbi:unnamed protein product [Prorocentrum cordatum]|uniref:Uncharacterized protein n=1 Tax=Prorocentrum cordatum TaxID=2364126 RepID=A0ABN9R7L7_9DINO|nr:unnamed protein product [Polarella glacialis]